MSDETVAVELELTEQQSHDLLRAINKGEIEINDLHGFDRAYELTKVWAEIYNAREEAFGGVSE